MIYVFAIIRLNYHCACEATVIATAEIPTFVIPTAATTTACIPTNTVSYLSTLPVDYRFYIASIGHRICVSIYRYISNSIILFI